MSEEIKNTPEEIEAVKAEDLEDTVEKENDAEAVIEEISTEEIIAEEPAAEAVAPAPVMKERSTDFLMKKKRTLRLRIYSDLGAGYYLLLYPASYRISHLLIQQN